MNQYDAETFLNSAVASLRAGLPAVIDAINVAKDDKLKLKVPQDVGGQVGDHGVAYSLGTEMPTSWPWVEVAVVESLAENFALAQADSDFGVTMIVRVSHDDVTWGAEGLYRMMMRYSSAIVRTLLAPNALGMSEPVSQVRQAYNVNPETGDSPGLYGTAVIELSIASDASIL